jgi:hypothetical protein
MRKRSLLFAGVAIGLVLTSAACTSSSGGNAAESQQQQADTNQMEVVLPLPQFQYSELREELIQIEAIQAFGLSSTSFFFNAGDSTPIGECASVGLPIPTTANLSNPWQAEVPTNGSNGNTAVAIGQMDPDGIYTGDSTGTNVLCKTSNGGTYLAYAEEYVHAVTAQAYWNPNEFGTGHGGIHVVGTPQIPNCSAIREVTVTVNGTPTKELASICVRPGQPTPAAPAGTPVPSASSK